MNPPRARRFTAFCNAWLAIGAVATADAVRRVSAQGYHDTMRTLGEAAP